MTSLRRDTVLEAMKIAHTTSGLATKSSDFTPKPGNQGSSEGGEVAIPFDEWGVCGGMEAEIYGGSMFPCPARKPPQIHHPLVHVNSQYIERYDHEVMTTERGSETSRRLNTKKRIGNGSACSERIFVPHIQVARSVTFRKKLETIRDVTLQLIEKRVE
ncbi:hypothetical protein EX30DRAFT_7428 [Ascodesmis nigricans]|uniref:Uncharacterized protein n=1 Tax=Ascodesmis nigricans TaxID=341454 RepID=A0A4S2N6H0_9PEZI|nr:hypothetical protein EX30DRAFT_7428 [Ascodesmis nigricans]